MDSGTCFWILGSVSSLRATVDRQSRSTFQRTVFFKQVSLMEFHFFRDQRQWSRLLLLLLFFFSKPSSSVLEPAYLFWLILNMCHLSNASLSLADTFICTHFCHWIRNTKKKSNNFFHISPPFSCLPFEHFSEWVKGRPSKGTRNSVNMQKWPAQSRQQKGTTCFERLLQNEWNNDVARFTTLESNQSCNKSGCEKLLLIDEGNLSCSKKRLNHGGKARSIAFSLVLQQCIKTSCTFLLAALLKLYARYYRV